MTENVEKFWMVWNPNGRAPTYRHDSKESATREAERLARANPEQTFIVLKAVGGFICRIQEPTEIKLTAATTYPAPPSDHSSDYPW